jgi:hypothetical protein
LIVATLCGTSVAGAAPAEPSGPHPRMLLTPGLRTAWKAHAKLSAGPVVGAIRLCEQGRTTKEHDRALYQGSEWGKLLQSCLVAYAATDDKNHAAGAIKFFEALLDDLDAMDDNRGGDEAARRDSGYAIRNLGPYTAIAYDWLHGHPLMTDALKAKARQRWKAWLAWHAEKGYRATNPGSNYHAGYLVAATTIAIAQAGEAGTDGAALWQQVADQMWAKEMAQALTSDGVLAGGNWPEGWQYGPLSVAEYALGARVMREAGVQIPGIKEWLSSVMRHHVYSLNPSDGVYPGGDNEAETPYLDPHVLTLNAIALGDASPEDKAWARGELLRLRLVDRDYFLYDALAAVGDKPVAPPRAAWPTWYLSANTGTLYTRTRWDESGVWFVAECHAAIETDHRHANAGTFALSRGKDNVIVDPTPYGSASTLTTNAPTVVSAHFPKNYIPSQGLWGETTSYDFITSRASGVVAARCDYSDSYKFQHRPSDVPEALRDFVLVPNADGTGAALLVIDRADTTSPDRYMALRFRTPGKLSLEGDAAKAQIGGTQLVISSVARSAGRTTLGGPSQKDCFKEGTIKGQCDAARFPVSDYRVQIPGPRPTAVHLISATGGAPASGAPLAGEGWAGVKLAGIREAVVIWRTSGGGTLSYTAPPGTHVILDATDGAILTAKQSGAGCVVALDDAESGAQKPLVATLDASCTVTPDPEAAAASAVGTTPARSRPRTRSPRSGCCGAEAAPGQSIAMIFVVGGLLLRRRRSVTRS